MCKHNAKPLSTYFALLIAYVNIIPHLLEIVNKLINYFS